ncbi:MAG: CHAT domain-containing protein [Chloroflexi bacterium]|nr:CHAT domain-containing protein [Chloroflexota bacterium]
MADPRYEDFEIELEPESGSAGRYRVRVLNSPAQEARGIFVNPLPPEALEDYPPSPQDAQAIGRQLFSALFRDQVLTRWRESEAIARERDRGLRLRLRVPPELAALPWELLFDPETGRFLAHSSQQPLVRQPLMGGAVQPVEVRLLRVLVALASPAGLPDLRVAEERARIRRALQAGPASWRIVADFVQGPDTLNQMRRRLRQQPYHVVHIVAHGTRRISDGAPAIVLEDENGEPDPVSGAELMELLADFRDVQVVVLSACESAQVIPGAAASALTETLLHGGIPAVIGMQWALGDEAGTRFAHELYAAISDGAPVDAALSDARERLAHEFPETLDWAAPVLSLRGRETQLFALGPAKPSLRAPAFRRLARGTAVGLVLAALVAAITRWLDPLGVLVGTPSLIALGFALVIGGASAPWVGRPPSRTARLGAAAAFILALLAILILGADHVQALTRPRTVAIAEFDGSKASTFQANVQADIYNALLAAGFTSDELVQVDAVATLDQALRRARQYRAHGILWGYYDDTKVVPYATIVGWSQSAQPQVGRVVAVDGPGTSELIAYVGARLPEEMKGLGLLVRGMVQEYQGDHAQAIATLTHAEQVLAQANQRISLRPVYTLRGRAHFLSGDLDEAILDYTEAIEAQGTEKDPLLAFAYNGRGAARFLQGDTDQAISDLDAALTIMPDHVQARFNRALVYLTRGEVQPALADATRVLELAPDFHRARLIVAACYIEMEQPDPALSQLDTYLKRFPNDANALYLRSVVRTMQGDLDAALKDVTAALEAMPDYVDALFQRAVILERQGNPQEALEAYRQVAQRCQSASQDARLRILCDRRHAAVQEAIDRLSP